MKRRMYILIPTLKETKSTFRDMLLARVPDHNIHILAKRGTQLGDLPEATMFQKTDVFHGAELGLAVGGILGVLVGVYFLNFPPDGLPIGMGIILALGLFGAVFGTWVAALIGVGAPNSQLVRFEKSIEDGQFLMMIDIPKNKVEAVSEIIEKRHPEALNKGVEPTMPAFP